MDTIYKRVPGNDKFEANISGVIRSRLDASYNPNIKNGYINIGFYGITRRCVYTWVVNVTWFEVNLPIGLQDRLFDITFKKRNTDKLFNRNSHYTMQIDKPIVYKDKYRLIPNYIRYGISKDNEVIDTLTDKILAITKVVNDYKYVYVYNPDRNKICRTKLHILKALALLETNNDPINKPIINHKDGDKYNLEVDNLEWVSYEYNNTHAVRNNLRSDNINCIVKDISGPDVKFSSISEACKYMGISRHSIRQLENIQITSKINGRYTIKFNGVKRKKLPPVCLKAVSINVDDVKIFNSIRECSRFFKVDKKTIQHKVDNNIIFRGYSIKIIKCPLH